jgi:hypothetical protein
MNQIYKEEAERLQRQNINNESNDNDELKKENQMLREELNSAQSVFSEHYQRCSYCEICQNLGFLLLGRY